MSKGLFITFEGGEGCGKSTLSNAVAKRLKELNIDYIKTREPGGTPISEQIRDILLSSNNTAMFEETEALLYAASRTQHTWEKIIPAVVCGKVVICDRYIGSSFAYQGFARNLGEDRIAEINDFGIHGYRPDIQFVIDTPFEVAQFRMMSRGNLDRLEQESVEFHKNVYNAFIEQAKETDYSVILDGTLSVEELTEIVINKVLEVMGDSIDE